VLTAAEGDDGDGNRKIFKKRGKIPRNPQQIDPLFITHTNCLRSTKKISKQFSFYTPRASAEMNCDKGHSTNDVKVEERKRPGGRREAAQWRMKRLGRKSCTSGVSSTSPSTAIVLAPAEEPHITV